MHLVHLAVAVDVIISLLLDWSDQHVNFFSGTSRERRLESMWNSYRDWCESQQFDMAERAQRKLFTTAVLKPDSGKYTDISQKVLNATGARYMVYWFASLAKQFCEWTNSDADMILVFV